ncbi:hypothetical protein [Natrononativus amylolyticus]|uniref:hypothetical protein n=1 Tax=Natrononativus amylolyticus TaxID=2963434 RepID=UPI0020CC73F9|nr:hypothetical protein [Natrononativus amylolyticus]
MDDSSVSRRHLLATLGASSLAGCANQNPLGSETGVRLGTLFVYNRSQETKSVQLQLRRDNAPIYENEIKAAEGYEVIDPSWSTEPAKYSLLWATDDDIGMTSIPGDFSGRDLSADCYSATFYFDNPSVNIHDIEESDEGTC